MSKTIVAFFDDIDQAEKARTQLISTGLSDNKIQLFSGRSGTTSSTSSMSSSSSSNWSNSDRDESFGDKIKHFFTHMGDWDNSDDVDYYAEGIRRGGATLSVDAEDNEIDRVSSILTQYGAADINQRAQFFKESGFSNYDMSAAPLSDSQRSEYRNQYSDWESKHFAGSDKDEEVIPVIEEKVNVGKRVVENGRVRIYTRVSETPVDQELKLRDERVDVERTAVDRPVSAADMNAFREGEIELSETSEEAVVDKQARVVEEVRVRRRSEEHTEQIHETARRTDVEVDRSAGSEMKKRDKDRTDLTDR